MTKTYDFELIKDQVIPEINSRIRHFRHKVTGAELLSVENEDENKVFGISFKTTPHDSTGVAHILEHAVLNGSEKYPIKEPFVELLKGSLQTFVNAFTFPDKTCYPCASQNSQDFYNLIDIYMDAVLHPLIPPHILDQEGWHYELDEEEGEMVYKGVVFNEMKGAMSDPDGYLGRISQSSLFPDNTYGFNSGGDPEEIPNLSYSQFKEFHEQYYHPSNARIFMYGDDDPEMRLKLMSEYLKEFTALKVNSEVPLQQAFSEPKYQTASYAVGEGEDPKSYLAMNWVLTENDQPMTVLGLGILSHILVGTAASPLRKALIDSGLGEDIIGGGLETDLRQITFSTGLKGIKNEDAKKVEKLIEETLQNLADTGIDKETIAASLNTIEFSLRENNTGSFPRGIFTMIKVLTTWLHDGDPIETLAFEAPLQSIKKRFNEGKTYFENLIKDFFLGNPHRSIILLEPDGELNQRKVEEETARLKAARLQMSKEEIDAIKDNTEKLKLIQETPDTPEALATLPVLKLEDLDRKNKEIPIEELEEGGTKVLYHEVFTNGILYIDLGLNLEGLAEEYLPYLDLFSDGLVKMGTNQQDFVKLSQRIGQKTGGIRPSLLFSEIRGSEESVQYLFVRGKSTMDNAPALLEIIQDVLSHTKYDNPERLKQIVLENKAALEGSLIPAGHRVVNQRLSSKQNRSAWVAEQNQGISQLFFLRNLLELIENDWEKVLGKFEGIRKTLLNRNAMLLNITLDKQNWDVFKPQLNNFLEKFPSLEINKQTWKPEYETEPEGLSIPAQVNYVGKGLNLYEQGYELKGSNAVIRKYMGTTYMWEKVRVQGGAYGGMISFDANSGSFNYLSYRDPNLNDTLDNYDGMPKFLRELKISENELSKSIIGTIGDLDGHLLPDAKGYVSMLRYLTKNNEATRQKYRDEILNTKAEDFNDFAEFLEKVKEKGIVTVLGSVEAIEEANKERDGFLKVTQVL